MLETFSSLKVVVIVNSGGTSTFRRRESQSVMGFTFVSNALAKDLQWHVRKVSSALHRNNMKPTNKTRIAG